MKIIYYDNLSLQLDVSDDFIVVMEQIPWLAYTYHNRKKKEEEKKIIINNYYIYIYYIIITTKSVLNKTNKEEII